MYQTVLFDLDGTLLNTLEDLASAGNHVCAENGWPTHPVDAFRYFVGNGIPKLCERFSPEDQRSEERLAKTLELFTQYYNVHKEDCTAPYPGIAAVLDALDEHHITYGVLTNKEHRLAQAVMQHYFPNRFRFVQGAVPGVAVKPDPTALLHLMETVHADPKTTLFVGDSNVDIRTALNANIDSCGVLWGFRNEDELRAEGATHIAATPDALCSVILR